MSFGIPFGVPSRRSFNPTNMRANTMSTPVAPVTVRLTKPLTSIDDAHKVVASVLGKLGCGGCLSGFDIRFTQERNFAVNPQSLAVDEIAH